MSADFETVYHDFDGGLRRFLGRRLADPAAVEDVLQETYLRIHRRADTLREPGRLRGWVYQIARNALIDHYRRQPQSVELPEALATAEDEPDANEAERDLARSMRHMLACLPAKYGHALQLTEFEGMTQPALAAHLGLSVSGAKSRVQRAREKLREVLLECCHVELDRRGQVLHYEPRCAACAEPDYFHRRAAPREAGCTGEACG